MCTCVCDVCVHVCVCDVCVSVCVLCDVCVHVFVMYVGVSKVPRLSSTDRKQMALGGYLRYD